SSFNKTRNWSNKRRNCSTSHNCCSRRRYWLNKSLRSFRRFALRRTRKARRSAWDRFLGPRVVSGHLPTVRPSFHEQVQVEVGKQKVRTARGAVRTSQPGNFP